jgi:hypothetical protein
MIAEGSKDILPSGASAPSRSSFIFACLETSLIIIGMLFLFFIMPRTLHGDGTLRYQYITDFLHHGLVVSAQNKYSLVGPLFSLPLLVIGDRLDHPVAWILIYNYLLFAFSLCFVYFLCKDRMDRGLLRKFLLLLVTASMFAAHLTSYYGEVFTAVCVGFGLMAVMIRFTSLGGWIAVILGVVNTPAALVGLGLVILKRIIDTKRLRYVIVLVLAGLLILTESWLRRGSIFSNGYANDAGYRTFMPFSGLPGFSYPFIYGLLSILFSFGKGLIFFAPGLLLPVRRTLKGWQDKYGLNMYQVYMLWISFLIGLILVYSRWWAWYGGLYWGPRFFLFASIPATFALAVRLHDKETHPIINILTAGILCLSTWVGICATIFQSEANLAVCMQNNYALEAACHYIPDFSVLWRPLITHPHLDVGQKLYVVYSMFVLLYFLVPLLLKIYQQLKGPVLNYLQPYLKLRLWRI